MYVDCCETVCMTPCVIVFETVIVGIHFSTRDPQLFPPPPPGLLCSQLASIPVSMSSWKPLRKPSSGKDCWVSLSHLSALSELGCRSTCVVLPRYSWEACEGIGQIAQ